MKVAVVHPSLNFAGGGEFVCLRLIKILQRRGFHVTLVTVERTDWGYLKDLFNEISFPDREFYLFQRIRFAGFNFLRDFFLLLFFLLELLFWRLVKRDMLIINTCGEKVLAIADLVYINGFPLRYAFSLPGINYKKRCYSRLYDLFSKPLDFVKPHIIVANSKFVAEIVGSFLSREILVIHPPVETRRFIDFQSYSKKENLVVVTARFLPNENLDFIPIIAGKVKDTHFYVVGPCRETSEKFLFDFKRLIAELGINNVKVLVNRPRGEYLELLLRAKIFFRTLLYETFGISVVEAMAAGCVPVVPRCGGPWFDIFGCKQGVYGFSYRSVEEAADLINMLLSDDGLRVEVATKALKRAKFFDRSVFERKILDLADRVFKAKFRRQN